MSDKIYEQHRQLRLKMKRAKSASQLREVQSQLLSLANGLESPESGEAEGTDTNYLSNVIKGLQDHPELLRDTSRLLSGLHLLMSRLNTLSFQSLAISDQLAVCSAALSGEDRLVLEIRKTELNHLISRGTDAAKRALSVLAAELTDVSGHA